MDLGSCYLGGNADAVEFCPHSPFRNVLAAATYTLQEHEEEQQKQDRTGTVSLFSVDAGAEDASRRLRLLHTVETAGVFDMKWSPAAPLLAQADARGRLALWRLEQEDGSDKGAACSSASILLKVAGADVNRKLFLGYATTAAAREGNIDILEMLLQAGATIYSDTDATKLYHVSSINHSIV